MKDSSESKNTFSFLITGGSGFLGKAIVEELIDPGAVIPAGQIRVFDINDYHGKADPRITYIHGDVRDYEALRKASSDIDILIHAAAIVDWGTHTEKEVYEVNFRGTENVVKVCRENNIKILIYTSSLDAVFTGSPLVNIDESTPFPEHHPNMYCKSKALSEVLVSEANGEQLSTCILRPSDVYGEGDPYHIDSLINMAKNGFYVRLGDGRAKCQHVYVGNMAHAHLLAASSLLNGNQKMAGNTYFITDGKGQNFFKFFDQVVTGAGYRIKPKNLWLPRSLAYAIGGISEFIAFLLRPIRHYNPKFSRFAVTYTCTDFTFSSDKAKNDFGYQPRYSDEEAMERTVSYYRKSDN